jgi:glutamine amidotransferase
MQLMCRHSEENDTPCLGIFDLEVKRFVPANHEKVPHMGWNNLDIPEGNSIYENMEDPHVYFVHSYYVPLSEFTTARSTYIHPFSAGIHRDNFHAVQFHPEKSGAQGQKIIENFLQL